MKTSNRSRALLPPYRLFRDVCKKGLSLVRPLGEDSAKSQDGWGWNFGSGWPPSYWAYGRMRALVTIEETTSLRPQTVLEVAAGDASLSAHLAIKGCRVTANDYRKENLENAVRSFSNASNIHLLPGNLFDLDPATTGLFDLVIACEVIEHVAHTLDFLSHLRKFVAPGGHVLITTPNGSYFRNSLPTHSQVSDFSALEAVQFKPDADGHLFLITPPEMDSLARSAGFEVTRMAVWGTPTLTGHVLFSKLSCKAACWLSYQLEALSQWLPAGIRQKACFNLVAVLRPV